MGSVTVHRAQIGIKANKMIEQRLSPSFHTISRLTMLHPFGNFGIKHPFPPRIFSVFHGGEGGGWVHNAENELILTFSRTKYAVYKPGRDCFCTNNTLNHEDSDTW